MRAIATAGCERLIDEIHRFPHAERLPREPYTMLHACFSDEESENELALTNRFQDWIDEETENGVQRRLLTLALDNFEHGRWGRLNKNALKRKNSHPNGWTDLRYATLPLQSRTIAEP